MNRMASGNSKVGWTKDSSQIGMQRLRVKTMGGETFRAVKNMLALQLLEW